MANSKYHFFGLTSASLHILAMLFMLMDHLWATIMPYEWMTCVGRLAFPIFAFMIAEGFYHTHNIKKYMLRIFLCAVITEIPFNLMYGGQLIYPYHQNVLWTFLIALAGLKIIEMTKEKHKLWITCIVILLASAIGFIFGYLLFTDYYGGGVLTVFVFYVFSQNRENNVISKYIKDKNKQEPVWKVICFTGQILCLYYINVKILGGYYYDFSLFGHNFELVQQELALLALIPIWMYKGKQGCHEKWFVYFCYLFYPVHCLVLVRLARLK